MYILFTDDTTSVKFKDNAAVFRRLGWPATEPSLIIYTNYVLFTKMYIYAHREEKNNTIVALAEYYDIWFFFYISSYSSSK